MPTGENTPQTLAEGLQDIIADARIRAEFDGIYTRVATREDQQEGTGLKWTRTIINKIEAQDIDDTTDNRNFQLFDGDQIDVEPTMTQIITKVTDRFYRKQAKVVSSKLGQLAGNAMSRKKDRDFLSQFSTLNTGVEPGAGQPMTFGNISAGVNRIKGNTTEPNMAEVNAVLSSEQIYDIQTQIVHGIGTYNVPEGLTEDTFRQGFEGTISGANVWQAGNIQRYGTTNVRGALAAKTALIWVQAMAMKTEQDRDMYFGGGADVLSMVDEYGFVEDGASSPWAFRLTSDATPPTA